MKKTLRNKGFMQIVFLAVVVIAGLAYFNIDIRTIFERPEIQKVWHILIIAWTAYIKPLFIYIWTNIGVMPSFSNMIPPIATSTIAM